MIDLHVHSSCSDGSDAPREIVDQAAAVGCVAIALTDHDTVAGLDEAVQRGVAVGVEVIAGIELSCWTVRREVHILGYFIDPTNQILADRLTSQQVERNDRNERLVHNLANAGLPITLDEVLTQAGGDSVGRPHLAAVLVRNGAASSIAEAFDRYLCPGSPAYVVRTHKLSAEDGVRWITEAGGVAAFAHPLKWGESQKEFEALIQELCVTGLVGLEALYGRYSSAQRRTLVSLASRFDLVATGGSDYHGSYKPDLHIGVGVGDLNVPNEIINELRGRRPMLF